MKADLKYFILRSETLRLYRQSLRMCRKLGDSQDIRAMREFLRGEVEVDRRRVNGDESEWRKALTQMQQRLRDLETSLSLAKS
jgi:hypothetical protein